jgi:acyl-CoA thioester hydrolase
VDFEVPFHDVDALRVVWHGHYYKYAELARTKLMRTCGLDGEELLKTGYGLYVVESKCRYVSPLRYADGARATAWFKDVANRLNIGFEITNLSTGSRAAKGHTILATVDEAGALLLHTPKAIRKRIRERPASESGEQA